MIKLRLCGVGGSYSCVDSDNDRRKVIRVIFTL